MADMYEKMLETALGHVGMWAERADKLAAAIYGLIEGDGPEDAAALLQEYGYCDEDGFWKDEEE